MIIITSTNVDQGLWFDKSLLGHNKLKVTRAFKKIHIMKISYLPAKSIWEFGICVITGRWKRPQNDFCECDPIKKNTQLSHNRTNLSNHTNPNRNPKALPLKQAMRCLLSDVCSAFAINTYDKLIHPKLNTWDTLLIWQETFSGIFTSK